jgi:hypothetical protein
MTTKVPAELSSTPSISDSGDATAITIGSNEKVGIGTTSTDHQLSVNAADYDGIQLLQGGTDTGYIGVYHDGSSTGRIYLGGLSSVDIQTGNGGATDGTTRVRVDSDGLKFGSDTAAANALDDYEEGTFTPTVKINSSTTGITGNFSGVYTKIGRQVTVVIIMGFTSKGSTTGNLSITVPFTSGDLSGIRMHGSLGYYNLSLSSGDHPRARLKSNVSEFQIHKTHEITPITDSNLANNTEIYITLTYFTA